MDLIIKAIVGNFIWIAILGILAIVGMGLMVTIEYFLNSTDTRQIPAYIARKLTRRGKYVEAGRWHIEAILSDGYDTLLSHSVLGPRRNDAIKFLNIHGDKLPDDLRNILTDLIWSCGFIHSNDAVIAKCASDSTPLIQLAEMLVTAANSPKQTEKIQKLKNCARICGQQAPKLSAALLSEPVIITKFPPIPMASPLKPDRSPSKVPRIATGVCCLCGTTGNWKGNDLYAKVSFKFQNPTSFFSRYIGHWEVLFCSKCIPISLIGESYKKSRRAVRKSGAFTLAACLMFLFLWNTGVSNAWPYVIVVICGLIAVIALLGSIIGSAWSRDNYEPKFYVERIQQFARDNQHKLLSGCDMDKHILHFSERVWEPTEDKIEFVVEPEDLYGSNPQKDEKGLEWFI